MRGLEFLTPFLYAWVPLDPHPTFKLSRPQTPAWKDLGEMDSYGAIRLHELLLIPHFPQELRRGAVGIGCQEVVACPDLAVQPVQGIEGIRGGQ